MDISWIFTTTVICILLISLQSVEMFDSLYFNGHGLEQNTKWKVERIQKLNIIKTEILKKMGLVDRPPHSLSSTIPPLNKNDTLDLKTLPIESEGDYIAEVQEVISLSEPAANIRNENIFQFRIAQESQGGEMEIERANVLVKLKYKQPRNRKKRKQKRRPRKIRLILSTVTDAGVQKDVISSLKAEVVKTSWFKLFLPQKLVEDTLKAREPVLKLHIKCKGCKKGAKLVLVHGSKMKRKRKKMYKKKRRHKKRRVRLSKTRKRLSKTRPFLLLHTRTKTFIRPKRDLIETCPSDKNTLCCKSPFLFRFSDVGWDDWIISPPSFRTAFCVGRCPSIKQCVETDHSDLRIIYYNKSGAIIISSIPNVIVTNCGCRR